MIIQEIELKKKYNLIFYNLPKIVFNHHNQVNTHNTLKCPITKRRPEGLLFVIWKDENIVKRIKGGSDI